MTVHRAWSHRPELAAEPSSVSSARAFVAGHPVDHEMADLVDDIELVVSELATNALVHAGSPFTVILGFAERRVLLEVLDGGHAGPTLVAARTLGTSGRGMAIVQALSRDWGVKANVSGGKTVWAALDIDAALACKPEGLHRRTQIRAPAAGPGRWGTSQPRGPCRRSENSRNSR